MISFWRHNFVAPRQVLDGRTDSPSRVRHVPDRSMFAALSDMIEGECVELPTGSQGWLRMAERH